MFKQTESKQLEGTMDFSDYNLTDLLEAPSRVFGLAGGLLDDIAMEFSYELNRCDESELRELINNVAPERKAQDNIEHARRVLGAKADEITIGWLKRSGCMNALSGAYWCPSNPVPSRVATVMWSGGVADWLIRRRNRTERLVPHSVGRVILPMGTRLMGPTEHPLVVTYVNTHKQRPTEADFAEEYVLPVLKRAGLNTEVFRAKSDKGSEVYREAFEQHKTIMDGTVLVVGNAPHTLQSAGQLRAAARAASPKFDERGDQLFMVSSPFSIAEHGEGKEDHQNPLSAVGQIVRNAYYLHKAAAN